MRTVKGVSSHYLGKFTVATLPTTTSFKTLETGDTAFATDGRSGSQGAGAGKGVPVFYDAVGNWLRYDGSAVAA